MEYEKLLNEAYKNVKSSCSSGETNMCGRFEILKAEGHHEGSKTIITNFGQIACYIRRKPEHLMKFLSKELASSGEISNGRLILSRKVSSIEVNNRICKYANLFVICRKCQKPDTELDEEGGKLFLRCLACGTKQEINKL